MACCRFFSPTTTVLLLLVPPSYYCQNLFGVHSAWLRERDRKSVYCHTVRWAPEKNNNSPQILAGHPNHRNERIPVLHSYNKVGRHVGRKKSAKKRQEKKKERKKKDLPGAPLHTSLCHADKKKKKRCVCDVKRT